MHFVIFLGAGISVPAIFCLGHHDLHGSESNTTKEVLPQHPDEDTSTSMDCLGKRAGVILQSFGPVSGIL